MNTTTKTPLALRAAKAIKENKTFTVQRKNEKATVTVADSKNYLAFLDMLTPQAKTEIQTRPDVVQIKLTKAVSELLSDTTDGDESEEN